MPQFAPAPGNSDSIPPTSAENTTGVPVAAHEIERAVVQRLQSHPSLRFARLNVHQCDHDSICLEGFLESNDEEIDLCEVVRGIHGIRIVVNHVVTACPPKPLPKKG